MKCRRPTGGRPTMVGLSVTGELADLWAINATGGGNTLLEEGDKVLVRCFAAAFLTRRAVGGVFGGTAGGDRLQGSRCSASIFAEKEKGKKP